MIKGSEIRKADFPIEPLLLDRWSPRAMSGEEIAHEELMRLFEAARWAPSSFNAQQWRALYARRGTDHWPVFFDLLVEANKSWAKNAAALVVFISRRFSITTASHRERIRMTQVPRGRTSRCKVGGKVSSCMAWRVLTTNVRDWTCAFPLNSKWKQWRQSAGLRQKRCCRKNYRSVRAPMTDVN
jgi:nitroreductase